MCLTALVNVYRLVRWAWTLAGVWFACIVGIVLSFHGFVTTKRNTAKAVAPTSTGLGGSTTPGITAIIPTHNEEGTITNTISHLIKHTKHKAALVVAVVDGSSTDGTVAEVQGLVTQFPNVKITVASCSSGRGGALNKGAAAATTPILLFLHADTLLPPGYDEMVRECVRRPENVAGAFTFGVDRTSFKTKCPTGVGTMEMFANFRARNFLLPYGDQAMFMTARRYAQIGPFPDEVFMEDFELTRRIRRQAIAEGGAYPILPAVALCDGRRWEMNGVLKNTLLNQYFVWLYTSRGYTPGQIYNMYYASKIKQGATPQPTARRSTASPSPPTRPAAPTSSSRATPVS